MKIHKPTLIKGGCFSDHRGSIHFVNDFDMKNIRRFYRFEFPDISIIRAWQGHQEETKYFIALKGSIQVVAVQTDDWDTPSKDLDHNVFYLQENKIEVLCIPKGFFNGFKALERGSVLLVFSDKLLKDSENDVYRLPLNYWKVNWNHNYR